MNALEKYRTDHKLTLEGLGKLVGGKLRGTVFRHCQAAKIPGDAALAYHKALGIPLEDLRPDLSALDATIAPAGAGTESQEQRA